MGERTSWGKQFERDMRDAAESVRAAFAGADRTEIVQGAAEFARTIAECAVVPLGVFLEGLSRAKGARAMARASESGTTARSAPRIVRRAVCAGVMHGWRE